MVNYESAGIVWGGMDTVLVNREIWSDFGKDVGGVTNGEVGATVTLEAAKFVVPIGAMQSVGAMVIHGEGDIRQVIGSREERRATAHSGLA